ncbi:hypothetical protein ACQ4PT_070653 [Festuca glaucescens]
MIVAVVLSLFSQMPSFHSLRYINLGSLILSFGYTILVSAACIRAGMLSNAPVKDYSLSPSKSRRTFDTFLSISILATVFCPTPSRASCRTRGPSLAPTWLLGLSVVLILLQLLAIALVYSQVAYEIMEKRSADAKHGRFSWRNLVPRVALRTGYVAACSLVAAALPFFGDIVGVIGAVGFIPLDFVLPVVMYNVALAPPRRSPVYIVNVTIIIVFTAVGVIGAVASVRKLVLDAGQFKLFSDHVVD